MKTALITGGLGFIGSHICIQLLEKGYNIVIIDNLSNSSIEKLDVIRKYNTHNCTIEFFEFDLIEYNLLQQTIRRFTHKIDVIIHLAGLKAVAESIEKPVFYYENNLVSTINLLKAMEEFAITNLIFSSSCTVYGSESAPFNESTATGVGITNPYGRSKYLQEEMLKDVAVKYPNWNIVMLRYFNPVGHHSLEFKEVPCGVPNNLFPYIGKVYMGELEQLTVFGSDYATRDGTCSRDFIHVVDLADAHICCSEKVLSGTVNGLRIYNVGTGCDTTVLELIHAFEKVNSTKINYKLGARRPGDVMSSYCTSSRISDELGWKSKLTIEDCVKFNM